MISEKRTRDLIAAAMASVADEKCADLYSGITQEPAVTSRIGAALENKLDGTDYNGWTVSVVTQDFPDRGRGSLERATGADIYVGIAVTAGGQTTSKGFLAQAKWADDFSDQERLREQCSDMLARTSAAYVWFYGPEGITFLPASTVQLRTDRSHYRGRPLQPEFARILQCTKGDPALGLPSGVPIREALGNRLLDLKAKSAVGVSIKKRG
jgi:hypothetical protein